MKKLKKFIFLLLLFAAPILLGMCKRNNSDAALPARVMSVSEPLLSELDTLLLHSDVYSKEKEEKVRRLRERYLNTDDPERRFWVASDLYEEYAAYDSDSALYYATKGVELALKIGREDLAKEMMLNRSYVLSATGLIDDAANTLRGIDVHTLSPDLALKYCDRMVFLSTHRDQYMGEERNEKEYYAMLSDSLLNEMRRTVSPENPQYGWFVGWSSLNSNQGIDEAIDVVSQRIKGVKFDTRQNAKDAWMLSSLYDRKGDVANRIKYLTLSAMADVRASNKEVASLEELAKVLYEFGDYDRASAYINYSIANANDYKSRVRMGPLASLQEQILSSIHERNERQSKVNRWYVIILAIILVLLIIGSIYIIRQNSLLRKSRQTLNEANDELKSKVDELSSIREELNTTNEKLQEMYQKASDTAKELAMVNETQEAHIADVFAISSNYIDKLESFRANLNKLLTARKFDEAVKLTKSPELSYQEIKELWATFDEIFLSIYPDFVDDFNTLLKPEDKIELKKPGSLNNELRIYALVRLGMNDSQRIARFLHCSVQTVYNTRQRTRNKAIVPREKFVEAVQNLGR